MEERSAPGGYVFISYVREDSCRVDQLQEVFEAAGIMVWRDTAMLWPGQDWRAEIRKAITRDALVFVACFSKVGVNQVVGYQNEELRLAVDQMRQRRPDIPWFIPVRFDNCDVPDLDIGGGIALTSIQHVDLFGPKEHAGIGSLVASVLRILDPTARLGSRRTVNPRTAPGEPKRSPPLDGDDRDEPDARASPATTGASGTVHNEIRGGTQHGPVLQGRDFTGVRVAPVPADQLDTSEQKEIRAALEFEA